MAVVDLPLWLDPAPAPGPALEGTVECEALVIGGGLAGTATALHLARRGVDVVLLERDVVGGGATGRDAGLLGSPTSVCYAIALKTLGPDRARLLWTLARRHRELVRESGIDCSLSIRGAYALAAAEILASMIVDGRSSAASEALSPRRHLL